LVPSFPHHPPRSPCLPCLPPPPPPPLYPLSLHDALPIFTVPSGAKAGRRPAKLSWVVCALTPSSASTTTGSPRRCGISTGDISSARAEEISPDRKSTRLNSSHVQTAYTVFCIIIQDSIKMIDDSNIQ